jgi:hypothetical protein
METVCSSETLISTYKFIRRCGLCFCNILAETSNFGLDVVLLSWLVSDLQKPCSSSLKARTAFRGYGLCFGNLLRNKLWSWRRSYIVLGFQATRASLTGNHTQDIFPKSWPSYILFLVSKNKHAKFVANRLIPSRVISEHTYPQFFLSLCIRFSPYVKQNTTLLHCKDQMVKAV